METKEIYNNKDNIHIFLKIQNPKSNKNAYYSISKENKILNLKILFLEKMIVTVILIIEEFF